MRHLMRRDTIQVSEDNKAREVIPVCRGVAAITAVQLLKRRDGIGRVYLCTTAHHVHLCPGRSHRKDVDRQAGSGDRVAVKLIPGVEVVLHRAEVWLQPRVAAVAIAPSPSVEQSRLRATLTDRLRQHDCLIPRPGELVRCGSSWDEARDLALVLQHNIVPASLEQLAAVVCAPLIEFRAAARTRRCIEGSACAPDHHVQHAWQGIGVRIADEEDGELRWELLWRRRDGW